MNLFGVSSTALAISLLQAADAFVLPTLFQESFSVFEQDTLEVEDDGSSLVVAPAQSSFWDFIWKPHVPYLLKPMVDSEKLQGDIELDTLNATAWELYDIAKASEKKYGHPTRVIGSRGHWKTLKYILDQFDEMSDYYDVSLQAFDALTGKINSFNLTDAKTGASFPNTTAFALSPAVKPFVGKLIEVPNLGCSEKDYQAVQSFESFANYKGRKIALIERGKCPFGKKSELAGKHGFHAVVVYDNEPDAQDGALRGTLGEPTNTTVATVGVPHAVGKEMIASIERMGDYLLCFAMDSYVKTIKTKNVVVDTKHGDPENIVALGAHSDSVEDGPGLNDDGSGTISLLTVAKQLTHYKTNNKVRFAFWAAEEEGLLGSNFYAYNLTQNENHRIRVFMDYDMMASPNYEYEVYDANNKDHPRGSEELRDLYVDYYKDHRLNYTLVPLDGRSDYVGFIENGIPAGGIAAGAEKKNVFNGDILDKCYHQLCDDVLNLNWEAFLVNTRLIAHSVATYAESFEGFPEREVANNTVTAISRAPAHRDTPLFKYRADDLLF
ncbi:aminopeptidase Y KNAG_0C01650 [Huiozyma naganishii CBS 8797]|uniref:Peptide hydrolase n=1 Tax=Huiozyma naganishii (strain ATCC MYA-139 / BCRC 22969 / CBS 8797 / KCTC 17520 / NBRC 10181 / NCYC 3082 / Yp74L-3) TaxID=1071383 RepID=J7S4G1_HUIN7|nr:hypothetical protein KNAG_0C01650 [Kazachstania naganishii CBS 8797]CCK69279.1 hypothetical protein KNAG_0C01650 [Kazachstania naganishii CBS 8797]